MHALLLSLTLLTASPWEAEVVRLTNIERAEANDREWMIYGSYEHGERQPLEIDPLLTDSAQWWCNALKGTGIFEHQWYINDSPRNGRPGGYLINPKTGRVLSRVWLPGQGVTNFADRAWYLGVEVSHENGALSKSLTSETAVTLWMLHGWHEDPRQVSSHCWNMLNPHWVRTGVGHGPWGAGRSVAFMEFGE